MEIGIGLDQSLKLTFEQHRELIQEATQLGYDSGWTPSSITQDAFQRCGQWWTASSSVRPGGLATGISVVPVPLWSPAVLAAAAGTVAELSGNRFALGVGSGAIYSPAYRQQYGLPNHPPIALMRDWLIVLRGLLDGERVDYDGKTVTFHGQLGFTPPRNVPIYLGTLGEQMLRLAGSRSDGAALNWCAPEQIAWSRERVVEGATRAGRDPAAVKMVEYIRICVDDDVDAARRAYTRALLGYALARPGASKQAGYRGHFARMGFDEALNDLEERRDRGASESELIENFPRDLALKVGYYGKPEGAAAAFAALAKGLDLAIVRVVLAQPGPSSAAAVMRACRPALVKALSA